MDIILIIDYLFLQLTNFLLDLLIIFLILCQENTYIFKSSHFLFHGKLFYFFDRYNGFFVYWYFVIYWYWESSSFIWKYTWPVGKSIANVLSMSIEVIFLIYFIQTILLSICICYYNFILLTFNFNMIELIYLTKWRLLCPTEFLNFRTCAGFFVHTRFIIFKCYKVSAF